MAVLVMVYFAKGILHVDLRYVTILAHRTG